jgi:RNA polymerase sigma-70 factor (ECF subfamily)
MPSFPPLPEEAPRPAAHTAELVRRAQLGEPAAFDELFTRYHERVLRIVRIRIGPELRRALDSMDAVQETFLSAVQDFDRFEMRDEGALVRWLAALAEHRLQDAARRHSAARRDALRAVPLEAEAAHPGRTPASLAARAEAETIVDEEIAALSEPWRELLLLRNVAGASWSAVTERLGYRTERAARVAHTKALEELALRLQRRGAGPLG